MKIKLRQLIISSCKTMNFIHHLTATPFMGLTLTRLWLRETCMAPYPFLMSRKPEFNLFYVFTSSLTVWIVSKGDLDRIRPLLHDSRSYTGLWLWTNSPFVLCTFWNPGHGLSLFHETTHLAPNENSTVFISVYFQMLPFQVLTCEVTCQELNYFFISTKFFFGVVEFSLKILFLINNRLVSVYFSLCNI